MISEELITEEEAPSTQPMSRLWWLEDTEPMERPIEVKVEPEPPKPEPLMISPAARTFVDWLQRVAHEKI